MGSTSSKIHGKEEIKTPRFRLMKDGAICIEMMNGSGAAVARGDLVVLDHAEGRNFFTTSTGGDDNLVLGMAYEAIADNAKGLIQIYGPTKYLKVNGTTDISAGDFISTYTEAGIGQQGTIGSGNCIAIACEAYATNDSLGVIDAFLLLSAR